MMKTVFDFWKTLVHSDEPNWKLIMPKTNDILLNKVFIILKLAFWKRLHLKQHQLYFSSFFLLSKTYIVYTQNKQYKRVFGSIFRLEHYSWCSTFTINIESWLIRSMNIFIGLQANIYWYLVWDAFWRKCFLNKEVFVLKLYI